MPVDDCLFPLLLSKTAKLAQPPPPTVAATNGTRLTPTPNQTPHPQNKTTPSVTHTFGHANLAFELPGAGAARTDPTRNCRILDRN